MAVGRIGLCVGHRGVSSAHLQRMPGVRVGLFGGCGLPQRLLDLSPHVHDGYMS